MRTASFKKTVSLLLATALLMTACYWVVILFGGSSATAWHMSVAVGSSGLGVELLSGFFKKKDTASS